MLKADSTPIEGGKALKPPIPLQERKSSSNLLIERETRETSSPTKDAPEYERAVSPSLSPGARRAVPTKTVSIQSNPSTGYMGLTLVQFDDGRIRIGGTPPKGPCTGKDISTGDILCTIDDQDLAESNLETAVVLLTAEKGQIIKLGLRHEESVDFELMVGSPTRRSVWFQQGESATLGMQLVSTEKGTRISEFLLDTTLPAQYSALRKGDVILSVNDMDVSTSSYDETLAAIVLNESPIFSVMPDATPIVPNTGEMMLSKIDIETSDNQALLTQARKSMLMSQQGSTGSIGRVGGMLKVVNLRRDPQRGLGLQVCTAATETGARVESVLPGTPAEACRKIKVGDHILQCNQLDLRHSSHEEVCHALALEDRCELLLEEDKSSLGYSDNTKVVRYNKTPKGMTKKTIKRSTGSPTRRDRGKSKKSLSTGGDLRGGMKTVQIPTAPGLGLGLKIKTDERKMVARISEVIKGKAASMVKSVKVGDRIINANGVNLVGKSHDDVIQAMLKKTPDGVVTLILKADKSPMYDQSLRKKVILKRKAGEGIGLKIHSAAQDHGVALGARISEVIPNSAASRVPNIGVGDWLISANGTNLERLSHDDIVTALKSITGSKIVFTLEADDSPMDDNPPQSPTPSQGRIVYADRKMLHDIRSVTVPRNGSDGLLGFQFYSELELPWSRVCDIEENGPAANIGLRPEDAIIEVDGNEVLNEGHDAVLHALRGDSKTVQLLVGAVPPNESPAIYDTEVKGASSLQVFPQLTTYDVVIKGPGIEVVNATGSREIVVNRVDADSPSFAAGVRSGDYLLASGHTDLLHNTGAEVTGNFTNALSNGQEVQASFGRPAIEREVTLVRPDDRDAPGKNLYQQLWGLDIVQLQADLLGRDDNSNAYMVAELNAEGVAATAGIQHGDVVTKVNGIPVTTSSVLDLLLKEQELTLSVLQAAAVPVKRLELLREPITISFGFGIKSATHVPGAFVTKVLPNSPAALAGVSEGDRITAIDGEVIGIRPHDEVLAMIQRAANRLQLIISKSSEGADLNARFVKRACLNRGNHGLGMKIVTKEDGISFPRISHVEKHGVAGRTGTIQYGDKIISANGKSLAGITSKSAVNILVGNETLVLELLTDFSEMYQITSQLSGHQPPALLQEVQRKDWYVGTTPINDVKSYVAAAGRGSFLIRKKRPDGSAYTLFIQDGDGNVKLYGVKWHSDNAQFVFGERYPFKDLLSLVQSLRKTGIPAAGGKRLHLGDAALTYHPWFVVDQDKNLQAFKRHVARAPDVGQFLLRQDPKDRGFYTLCVKTKEHEVMTWSIKWSSETDVFECIDEKSNCLFSADSVKQLIEVCRLDGIQVDDFKVQLGDAAEGYSVNHENASDTNPTDLVATLEPPLAKPPSVPEAVSAGSFAEMAAELDKLTIGALGNDGAVNIDSTTTPDTSQPVQSAGSLLADALAAAKSAAADAAAATADINEASEMQSNAILPDLPATDSAEYNSSDESEGDEDLPPLPEEEDDEDEDDDLPDLPSHQQSYDSDDDLPDLPPVPPSDDDDDDDDDDDALPPLPDMMEVDLETVHAHHYALGHDTYDDTEV